MGYNTYTTDDLVDNIKLIGHVPTGNSTFTNANLINLANRELQLPIMKQILSTRGGYYLTYEDYEAAQDGLYVIPANAIAGALANVELIQSPTIVPVNLIEESEQFSTNSPTSTSYGFFMRGNYVQILPTPPIGVTRLWFFKRPSQLISTSLASQITAINGAVYTVDSVPSVLTVGKTIEVLGDQPPFNILGEGEIASIDGTDIELDAAVTSVAVGDWIALQGQTPIPQIPVEFRPLLEQRVVSKVYELQGYLDKKAASDKALEELEQATFSLITPRVKSQTKVINPVNGGFLSGNQNRMTNFPAGHS
jgi:hypothetical protein